LAVTLSGGSGTSAVRTTGLLVRAGPAPLAFTACTEKREVLPLVSPVISRERWLAPTARVRPAPCTTYRRIGAPSGAAGPQLTRARASPAEAVTLRGALGLLTAGFFGGGGGGGVCGGSPPRMSLAYLSTGRTVWCSSTTRAVEEFGALMKRRFSRTSNSSGPLAPETVTVSTSVPF